MVLELHPSKGEVIDGSQPPGERPAEELVADKRRREKAFGDFMTGMVEGLSEENRKQGGDGNVFGAVIE